MINVISKVIKKRFNFLIGHKFALIKYKPLFFKKIKSPKNNDTYLKKNISKIYLLPLKLKFYYFLENKP